MASESTTAAPGGRAGARVETEPGVTLDPRADGDPDRHDSIVRPHSPAARVRLRETERAVLAARVDALERTVAERDRQLAGVIDRYETILEDRDTAGNGAVAIGFDGAPGTPDEPDDDSTAEPDRSLRGRVAAALRTVLR